MHGNTRIYNQVDLSQFFKIVKLLPYEVYVHRWNELKANSRLVPFEVELESELSMQYQSTKEENHSPSSQIRSRIVENESRVKSRIIPQENIPQTPRINHKALLEMFEVYASEMEMRKQQ